MWPGCHLRSKRVLGSVRDERMSTDQLKGGVKKVIDQPDDDQVVKADHLQHLKKPPAPMRGASKKKTWNQQQPDTVTNQTSPVSPSLRKTRSEVISKSNTVNVGDGKAGGCASPRLLRKVKSTPPARSEGVSKLSTESGIGIQKSVGNIGKEAAAESVGTSLEKMGILIEKDIDGSDACQEKLITCSVNGNERVDELENKEEGAVDEKPMEEEEIEIKEVSVPDKKVSSITDQDDEEDDVKVYQSLDKKPVVGQSALVVKQPPRYVKRSAYYSDFNRSSHHTIITEASTNVVKPCPKLSGSKFTKSNPSSTAPAASILQPQEFRRHSASEDRLQSLVDLVMWRDVSRSAFVFGIGIFMIISSSYTQDLNISFVSVTSYLGLSYLALIFLFRSILHRGVTQVENDIVVGEEEAIWIVQLVLPYVNEFFLTLSALFSGAPATTMKLAVVLFVLARCGSSITIWKMAKLGFIGVFTLPRIVALYSIQLKTQCKFWIERFRDAWDTCSHKKIIAGIIFGLIWNLCSVVARIWALFMIAVAFRYYQQLMAEDKEWKEGENNVDGRQKEQRTRVRDTSVDLINEKKGT